jgi:hypothetical protein
MATTFHIPPELLTAIDERARAQKISRNRFVILSLKKALENDDAWSPEFLEALEETDESTAKVVDAVLEGIKRHRSSKGPASL